MDNCKRCGKSLCTELGEQKPNTENPLSYYCDKCIIRMGGECSINSMSIKERTQKENKRVSTWN